MKLAVALILMMVVVLLPGCASEPEKGVITVPDALLTCPQVPVIDGTKLPFREAEKAQFVADLYIAAVGCRDNLDLVRQYQQEAVKVQGSAGR